MFWHGHLADAMCQRNHGGSRNAVQFLCRVVLSITMTLILCVLVCVLPAQESPRRPPSDHDVVSAQRAPKSTQHGTRGSTTWRARETPSPSARPGSDGSRWKSAIQRVPIESPSARSVRKPLHTGSVSQVAHSVLQPPAVLDLNDPELSTQGSPHSESEEPISLPPVRLEDTATLPAESTGIIPPDDSRVDSIPFNPSRVPEIPPTAPRMTVDSNGIANIPFRNSDTVVSRRDLEVHMNDGLITLIANQASLSDILSILAQDHGLNIVSSDMITQKVTVTLRDVPLADALNAILSIQGLSWSRRNNIISITRVTLDQVGGAIVQGRVIRVYPLSYVTGTEVETVIKDLLSPVGKVKSMQSEKLDSRKSSDRLIVEDLPEYLDRIDLCIQQLDRPPRQVQIEAHILEVDLSAENRHGVNLEMLSDLAGTKLSIKTPGLAKATSNPALLVGIDGSKVDGLLDALKSTVDARTLASPQVLVTHGQEARIQIGGKIGYRQSTTTETSTVQGVEFIDVGVVLIVTPYIGTNGQVLMKVNPEVSDGSVDLQGLPSEQLTTVDSTVLLDDGQGMVIGGLIRETDNDQRLKASGLGELWMIGRLFQQSQKKRSRTEVIVVLVPRIVETPRPLDAEQQIQLDRTETPLFHGALEREFRPWEPELPEVRFRPRDTRRNFQEFRRSGGANWIPEPPRSGEYFLKEPTPTVPVIMEAVPQAPALLPQNSAENKTPHGSEAARRASHIPSKSTASRNSTQQVAASGKRIQSKAVSANPSISSQILAERQNQASHRHVNKSESSESGPEEIRRSAGQYASSSKGINKPER